MSTKRSETKSIKELIDYLEQIKEWDDQIIEGYIYIDKELIDEIIKRLTEYDLQGLRKFDVTK